MSARTFISAALPAAGVAAAALWPVTAYAVSPLIVPGLVLAAAAAAVVILRPEYGIALALAIVPLSNVEVGLPLGVWLLPGLSFGLFAYAALVSTGAWLASRWLVLALFLMVAVTIASAAFALDPAESVKGTLVLASAVALFLAAVQICRGRREAIVVAGGAVAALLVASVHGLLQWAAGSSTYAFVADGGLVERVHGAFVSPNKFGGFVAILIPLAGALALSRAAPGALRWLASGSLVVGVPALVFSYSRGAMVGVMIGTIVWLALVRPRVLPIAAAVGALAFVGVAPSTLEQRFEAGESSDALVERGDIWSAALDIYAQHPVIGTGINNFSVAYARLPSTLSDASQRRLLDWEAGAATIPFHAHNAYLNLLAEQGIVGLAAFLVFALGALAVLYRGSRASDALTRAVCLGAGAGWMTWAVRNLVDVALYEEVTYPLLTLTAVASVLVALEERPVEVPRRAAIATAAG